MWNHLVALYGRGVQPEVRELERRLRGGGLAGHLGQPHQRVPAVRPEAGRHRGQGHRSVLQAQALLHGPGAPRRGGVDGDRLGQPDRAAAPRLAVPAGAAPREARARPFLRHAERGHRGHVDLLRRVRVQRRDGPLRLQARRQEGDVRPVQRLQADVRQGPEARATAQPRQSRLHALGAASCVGRRGRR